jgi:hypothetical protein
VPLTHLGAQELTRIGDELDVDLTAPDDDGLFLLRHTLMNPWLLSPQAPGAPTYVEAYVQYLADLVRRELRS